MSNQENIAEIKAKIDASRSEIEAREIQIAQLESQIRGLRAMNKLDERIIKLNEGAMEMISKLGEK